MDDHFVSIPFVIFGLGYSYVSGFVVIAILFLYF